MDISTLSGVSPAYLNTYTQKTLFDDDDNKTNSFDSILSAMMQSVDETNDLQNKAESEEIRFALGESDNTHDHHTSPSQCASFLLLDSSAIHHTRYRSNYNLKTNLYTQHLSIIFVLILEYLSIHTIFIVIH